MVELDETLVFATSRVAARMEKTLTRQLEEFSITRVQWIALSHLAHNGELCQKKLAELMHIRQSTVVGLIDRMEKEGLVKRKTSKTNRRVNLLRITEKGYQLHLQMRMLVKKFVNEALEGIPDEKIETYISVLESVDSNIAAIEERLES